MWFYFTYAVCKIHVILSLIIDMIYLTAIG